MSSVTSTVSGRSLLRAPFGQELVETDRIDDDAREDMRADLGAFLDHDDARIRRDLLQADGGGETGRPRADDHDIEIHALTFRQFLGLGLLVGHRSSSPETFPETTGRLDVNGLSVEQF